MPRNSSSPPPRNCRQDKIPGTQTYYRLPEVMRAVPSLLAGGRDPENAVSEFEQRYAATLAVPEAMALPSARVALYYLLRALQLPPGSEVLVTPLTIADIINVIVSAGLTPVMVDLDPDTLACAPDELAALTTARTRVLVLTYLYGLVPATQEQLLAFAAAHQLLVIEDISQALGAEWRGRRLGSLGFASICSLSSFKFCSTLYGGMVVCRDAAVMARLRTAAAAELAPPPRLLFAGMAAKIMVHRLLTGPRFFSCAGFYLLAGLNAASPALYYRLLTGNIGAVTGLGRTALFTRIPAAYLFRFTAAQARLGDSSLQRLPQVIAALRTLAQTLTEDETIRRRLPALARDGAHAYWRLPLRTRALAQFSRQLLRHGIGTSTNLLPVCSELPGFRQYVRRPCPGALRAHREYLLLPVHAWLTPSQRHRLCRVTSDLCRHAE